MADETPNPVTLTGAKNPGFARFSSQSERRIQSNRTPWLSRRHTPYVKTPKTGRTSQVIPQTLDVRKKSKLPPSIRGSTPKHSERLNGSNSEAEERGQCVKAQLQDFVGKTVRIYHVSPLFNFQRRPTSLRNYESQLCEHLDLESEKEILFASHTDTVAGKYNADISVIEEIVDDDSNSSAIKITVTLGSKNGRSIQRLTPVLSALICSVGNVAMEDAKLRDHFTSLPVCLLKGPAILARSLIAWIEIRFDCRVSQMTFSSMDLGWFFSLWAGLPSPSTKSVPVELWYDVSSAKGLSRILFSIDEKNAREIWEEIHSKNTLIYTEEESIAFMKTLESHFYHHFKIQLAGLPLTRVRTSVAYIGSEGRMKIVQLQYIDHILEQLTQAALTKEFYGRL